LSLSSEGLFAFYVVLFNGGAMKFSKIDEGKRVVLKANDDEGWPEQRGVLIEVCKHGMLMIQVDAQYATEKGDDGLRETHEDGVEFDTICETPIVAQVARLVDKATPRGAVKPTLYASMDDTGRIYLSAYKSDDPQWENNHIIISEVGRGVINKHHSALTILGNVLYQAGVNLITE
jgi:hypothetical protein